MVSITYGTDGRMATASFLQGSSPKTFAWQYLTGSSLPAVMTMPNSMSLEWGYEEQRNLVTSMTYKRGTTVVAARGYTYDNLGRPISDKPPDRAVPSTTALPTTAEAN